MRQALLLLLALGSGCASGPVEGACDGTEQSSEAITYRCAGRSFAPVLDPESPDYGRIECVVVEFMRASSELCDCEFQGYAEASPAAIGAALDELEERGICRPEPCEDCCAPSCEEYCFCELVQFSGEELAICQDRHPERSSDEDFGYGWCYLEPALGLGSESSTAHCPLSEQREFRILTPLPNYSVVVGCEGPPG